MDRISLLPNDFILQILSLLPTKDVLKTTLLSKRWLNLWKFVPKLEYIDCDRDIEHCKFLQFVDRSLLLNSAPVIESLHFKLGRKCSEVDIGFWIRFAVERGLRELNFEYCYSIKEPSRLPRSLYTCGTLVVLKLRRVSLEDVQFPVCFKLLKTLHLVWVIFLDNESPQKLLSSCPVLEVLVLDRIGGDNVTTFSVTVPSLQRFIYDGTCVHGSQLVVNTSSLKFLKTTDFGDKCMIEYMPEIVEASVLVTCDNTDDILRSLRSVKRLLLCLPPEKSEWAVLMNILQHSPKLRSLKLNETHGACVGDPGTHWDEPSSVPETLVLVLETFEWRNFRGWNSEIELAKFILKNSSRLKIATFSPQAEANTLRMSLCRMITQLVRLSRGSAECELVFV